MRVLKCFYRPSDTSCSVMEREQRPEVMKIKKAAILQSIWAPRPLMPLKAPNLYLIVLTLDRQSSCLRLSVVVPHRITESTSSCGSAGTTRGWSYRRTSSPILSPLIPRCSNVSGNLTCSSPTRRAPTFTTSPKRIFSSSFSVMETSSSVWGNEFYLYVFSMSSLLRWVLKIAGKIGDRPEIALVLLPALI